MAALIAVPLPFKRPVTEVVKVIAGVVVFVATVPAKPFAVTTETDVTVPELPEEAAVIKPFALTVILAFVKLPTLALTVASVPEAPTFAEPSKETVDDKSPEMVNVRAVVHLGASLIVMTGVVVVVAMLALVLADVTDVTVPEPLSATFPFSFWIAVKILSVAEIVPAPDV